MYLIAELREHTIYGYHVKCITFLEDRFHLFRRVWHDHDLYNVYEIQWRDWEFLLLLQLDEWLLRHNLCSVGYGDGYRIDLSTVGGKFSLEILRNACCLRHGEDTRNHISDLVSFLQEPGGWVGKFTPQSWSSFEKLSRARSETNPISYVPSILIWVDFSRLSVCRV